MEVSFSKSIVGVVCRFLEFELSLEFFFLGGWGQYVVIRGSAQREHGVE